jgi:hypothetical protein
LTFPSLWAMEDQMRRWNTNINPRSLGPTPLSPGFSMSWDDSDSGKCSLCVYFGKGRPGKQAHQVTAVR